MLAEDIDIVIGVDTHKLTHTAAGLSATGAVVDRLTVPADPKGYRRLIAFGEKHGAARAWAIEGTGSFGAGLTTMLVSRASLGLGTCVSCAMWCGAPLLSWVLQPTSGPRFPLWNRRSPHCYTP